MYQTSVIRRCDRIRTCDLCVPNAALYQAEPRIDSACQEVTLVTSTT